jgi:uroporphyrinogen decarboxylase
MGDSLKKKETLTSRDRVLRALRHEQPDRVPIDLGGNQTGIHKFAYQALIEHLGIEDEIQIVDAVQQLAQPCEALLERFHVDTRYIRAGVAAGFQGKIVKNTREGEVWHDLTDEFGVTWSMPDSNPFFMDISHHPLASASLDDLRDYPFPKGDDPGRFGFGERASHCATKRPNAVSRGISAWCMKSVWNQRRTRTVGICTF